MAYSSWWSSWECQPVANSSPSCTYEPATTCGVRRIRTTPAVAESGMCLTGRAATAIASERRPQGVNETHLAYLASPAWAEQLRREVLPWLDTAGDLGDHVLEIGPGPGLSTDLLRERVAHVTAVEVDRDLATALQARLAGSNVDVLFA